MQLSFITLACDGAYSLTLDLAVTSQITDLTKNESKTIEAGVKTPISETNPMWIQAPGRIPVLLIPLKAQDSIARLDSPKVEQVFREDKDLKIDDALSEVTLYLTEIHRSIGVRDLVVARQKLSELRGKYPNVKFLNFIEASIAFLAGQREQALSFTNLGLAAHPSYGPGVELKKMLEKAPR